MSAEWIGYTAATLASLSFVPQALKATRSRETHGISLAMYVVFTLGVGCWLVYGAALGSWPMILPNTITLGLAATILALKLEYG